MIVVCNAPKASDYEALKKKKKKKETESTKEDDDDKNLRGNNTRSLITFQMQLLMLLSVPS